MDKKRASNILYLIIIIITIFIFLKAAIKMRVIIALKYWVETQFIDFEEDLIIKMQNFIDNTLKDDGNFFKLFFQISKKIKRSCGNGKFSKKNFTK